MNLHIISGHKFKMMFKMSHFPIKVIKFIAAILVL